MPDGTLLDSYGEWVETPFRYENRDGVQTSFILGIKNAPAGERAEEATMDKKIIEDRINKAFEEEAKMDPRFVSPPSECEAPRRPWKDCQIEEKLERLRVVADESAIILLTAKDELKYLQRRMARLERHLELMNDHEHGRNGRPVISPDTQAGIGEISEGTQTLAGTARRIAEVLAPLK